VLPNILDLLVKRKKLPKNLRIGSAEIQQRFPEGNHQGQQTANVPEDRSR